MVGRYFYVCAALFSLAPATVLPRPASAAWPTDPLVNVPLCTAAGNQQNPACVSDGAGGAITTWQDFRVGVTGDIYVQRVLADGAVDPAWPVDGRALCTSANDQRAPMIVADGAGGAIVTWQDLRTGSPDIYAQHVLASGAVDPTWPADGRALCNAAGKWSPTIVADGAGGAIVTWYDYRNGTGNSDIYAQHVLASGSVDPAWPADGLTLCAAANQQRSPTIDSDGAGGAIVSWYDYRNGTGNSDIYAQHVMASGSVDPAWPADGTALCTDASNQHNPKIVTDGAGGAIVAWYDSSDTNHIYAQRVLANGTVDPAWPADGRALCTAAGGQWYPMLASDNAGGAIVTWFDYRNGTHNPDIYAQHVTVSGAVDPAWPADGTALCTAAGGQEFPKIISDSAGGAIVTWYDSRSGSSHIYAQRVLAGGAVDPMWPADGRAVCVAADGQGSPVIVTDGAGGAIVSWFDFRSGTTNSDIYAQRVQANGELGGGVVSVPSEFSPALSLDSVRPNPTRGGALTVRFTLASTAAAWLELLDVAGRRIVACEVGSLGTGRHALNVSEGRGLPPGLYLLRLRQGISARVTRVAVLD